MIACILIFGAALIVCINAIALLWARLNNVAKAVDTLVDAAHVHPPEHH